MKTTLNAEQIKEFKQIAFNLISEQVLDWACEDSGDFSFYCLGICEFINALSENTNNALIESVKTVTQADFDRDLVIQNLVKNWKGMSGVMRFGQYIVCLQNYLSSEKHVQLFNISNEELAKEIPLFTQHLQQTTELQD